MFISNIFLQGIIRNEPFNKQIEWSKGESWIPNVKVVFNQTNMDKCLTKFIYNCPVNFAKFGEMFIHTCLVKNSLQEDFNNFWNKLLSFQVHWI